MHIGDENAYLVGLCELVELVRISGKQLGEDLELS